MSQHEFGKYWLIAELGSGGMADVFLAVAMGPAGISFSKLLVVKRLKHDLGQDPQFISMIIDEARIAARLNHPNVVQTNEVGQVNGQFFLTMEFLEGQSLHRILHKTVSRGGMPPAVNYRILADVLAGLHHAHELVDYDGSPLEIVHRDVSPQNIFVTYDGQVKVVDFGIAKAVGRASETRTGIVKGKVTYMAPEQAMGGDIDRRADVFSVGVMLWEAAAGRRMWRDMQDLAVLHNLSTGNIPLSPRAVRPEVPERLDKICARALAPRPEDRYSTALEFQNDIEEFLRESGEHVSGRDIAKVVLDHFADRRAQLKTIIEKQLSALRTKPTSQFETVPLSVETTSQSGERSTLAAAMDPGGEQTSATLVGPTTRASLSQARARRRLAAIVLLTVSVLTMLWFTFFDQRRTPEPQPIAQTAASSTEAAPNESVAHQLISLTFQATPPTAKFRLDGGESLSNPHVSRVPRDTLAHQLTIDAPGYVEKNMAIRFEDDLVIELALEPEAAPSASAKVRRAVVAPPVASQAPQIKRPRRSVDTIDF